MSDYRIIDKMVPTVDVHDRYNGEGNVKRDNTPVLTDEQIKQRREERARAAEARKRSPTW